MAAKQTKAAGNPKTAPKKNAKSAFVRSLIAQTEADMQTFINEEGIAENLTGTARRRLFSAGVRNYGFIDKAFDIAQDNPQFMPPNFNLNKLFNNLRDLEDLRQLMLVLQQFEQLVSNAFMLQADSCYRDALRIYNSLKEQTKAKVPGAQPLFEALKTFFRKRRGEGDEPTEIELERDIKRLIHGHADGKITIENESPKIIGGIHKVIDDVHSGRSAFKETAQAEVDEGKGKK
ncbi:MAG: hypothetical protein LBH43_06440 [Treponema sp.]|jgi:hypothetical protein|nr:hypothetical protein [Treponema sp.]